jgi:hypothetical protein
MTILAPRYLGPCQKCGQILRSANPWEIINLPAFYYVCGCGYSFVDAPASKESRP